MRRIIPALAALLAALAVAVAVHQHVAARAVAATGTTVTLSTEDWARLLHVSTSSEQLGSSEQDVRIKTALEATQPPPAPASITDRLSADKTSVEVTGLPTGTTTLHVAVMKNLAGEGISYLNLPASQTVYTPPAGQPVVDMLAESSTGAAIGGWAGRIQTTPAGPPPSTMAVGLDTGGWAWESAVADAAGAVQNFRSSYTYYNSAAPVALLQKYGVKLWPMFGCGCSSIGSISASSYASTVVGWFKAFGDAAKADTAEVLNEPGNPYFYSDPANYAAYINLVRTTKQALVANGFGYVKVLVSWDGGYGGDSYGETLVSNGLRPEDYDGVDVHPYGGHGSESALGNRERVTRAFSDAGKPVYVTEVGWPTCGETGDSLNWTEQQQAENITRWVQWTRSLGYVALTVNFNYADYEHNCYGIVKAAGSPHKLSYAALKGA